MRSKLDALLRETLDCCSPIDLCLRDMSILLWPANGPIAAIVTSAPTLILIYRKPDDDTLEWVRLGSHSELGF